MPRRIALAAFAAVATLAAALDTPPEVPNSLRQLDSWPPPAQVVARMRELQLVIGSREATPEQREAARAELGRLLRSPAGQVRPSRDEHPPRAAIDPFPSIVRPAVNPAISLPPVAHIEVVEPPRPALPRGGVALDPAGRFAIDPRTGAVLHQVPGAGYLDPRTGRFVLP